ncbi:branched-chain amino acid ABC transporter permease [Pseudonocardia sp. KRD-184]|uniref:Branched-chain amino acid ABC transporter permease n=1 Tax=Pseudonocardia oceani TaxID=2792013 RepID=A0ABS6UE03_9PSEU|nr:branched-chain amino acid ABC transporter permease [Pseudonocardia oceani]MBW0090678.1 branched-chain amino acid ABC transporter permease [Pseudonocardia oceani]MBW0097802.1 branched-chain amino acid ABC transporter permease [Pseudonocardia oceani]MBW0112958.1 branched-chain amino acid ABC transporter permease [Pseudonocardia oceani]MBW0121988.1 branched-chain amino acid ABC transporter permease [Pseudonocardia oceani]MBW0130482.1 branched-chain amino acid ABC transporter permease [Pseudono
MGDLLQFTIAGLSQGAVYALVAMGFVAVFSVSGVINLAQGEFAAIGGLVALSGVGAGLPLPLALVVALLVVALVAVLMQRLAIAPVRRMTTLVSIILTLGVSTALKALMLLLYGPQGRGLPPLPGPDLVIGGVSVRAQELWILGVTAVVAVAVTVFYDRTMLGKALRACAEQPVAARLVGISPVAAATVAFAVAGLLGAVAGVLASPIQLTQWDSGLLLGLKGFVAATLGGLVSIRGAVLGGLVLGVLESLVAGYVDSGYRDAVAFVLLIVVLVARPGGVFGRHAQARV